MWSTSERGKGFSRKELENPWVRNGGGWRRPWSKKARPPHRSGERKLEIGPADAETTNENIGEQRRGVGSTPRFGSRTALSSGNELDRRKESRTEKMEIAVLQQKTGKSALQPSPNRKKQKGSVRKKTTLVPDSARNFDLTLKRGG